jgi:hypothetical protein
MGAREDRRRLICAPSQETRLALPTPDDAGQDAHAEAGGSQGRGERNGNGASKGLSPFDAPFELRDAVLAGLDSKRPRRSFDLELDPPESIPLLQRYDGRRDGEKAAEEES